MPTGSTFMYRVCASKRAKLAVVNTGLRKCIGCCIELERIPEVEVCVSGLPHWSAITEIRGHAAIIMAETGAGIFQ